MIGPCSIHDPIAALEYASRLKHLAEELQDQLYIVMRVYFEKPRTTVGWKGLINDPKLDGSFDVEHGLHIARALLLELAEMGLPLATEALNPLCRNILLIYLVGLRLVRERQNHKRTEKCHQGYPWQWDLKWYGWQFSHRN